MFWFDRKDERAVFGDKRSERYTLKDKSSKDGARQLSIAPDFQLDFRHLPFLAPWCPGRTAVIQIT
jgi:rRNA maturation protein Nop10